MSKVHVGTFAKRKAAGEKIVMITAGDAPGAQAVQDAGIDVILVGDSLGMTMLGYDSTLPVTMEEMIHHTKAVRRGAPESFVVFDMPFMSYQISVEEALRNAGRAIKETGADAVKLEGAGDCIEVVKQLVKSGIPVMAHLGLLPQHLRAVGTYKVVGRSEDEAAQLLADAKAVEAAGAFAVVLECVPAAVAKHITESINIPTIGIGSGAGCSGQVQVMNDTLGVFPRTPKHAKRYAELGEITRKALKQYAEEVKNGTFPGEENSF